MALTAEEKKSLDRLHALTIAAAKGPKRLSAKELQEFPALYRYASSLLVREETSERAVEAEIRRLRSQITAGHGSLYREKALKKRSLFKRTLDYFLAECPRAIRQEWRLVALLFGLVYGTALLSYIAVRRDLGLAYSLMDAGAVSNEIAQLQRTAEGEPFRGNFTFGTEDSPMTAGWILAHNMGVSVMFFAFGLFPPLFLWVLLSNGMMLGTYTAVAAHWGQAGAISSILWCHGTLEIQAIILAGAAGVVLTRAWVAPGPWTRGHALQIESKQALRLLAPMFPILFLSGLIEGFVSPHAPFEVRMATAVSTGLLLLAWVLFGGRVRNADRDAASAQP